VVLLKPRDEARFAQRVWADKDTGLMLRADVLSPQGQLLESSAFSDVEIDGRPSREHTLNPAKRLEGYRVVQVRAEAAALESEGWSVGRLPPGFKLLACVQRPLGHAADDANGRVPRALQAVFSDGLARVSVFIEPADRGRQREPLMTNLGATHTLMKPRDGRWWITVMGDVPMATLKTFFDATVRKP
jgi:sigma-E factor negative regulatory protein RseB